MILTGVWGRESQEKRHGRVGVDAIMPLGVNVFGVIGVDRRWCLFEQSVELSHGGIGGRLR